MPCEVPFGNSAIVTGLDGENFRFSPYRWLPMTAYDAWIEVISNPLAPDERPVIVDDAPLAIDPYIDFTAVPGYPAQNGTIRIQLSREEAVRQHHHISLDPNSRVDKLHYIVVNLTLAPGILGSQGIQTIQALRGSSIKVGYARGADFDEPPRVALAPTLHGSGFKGHHLAQYTLVCPGRRLYGQANFDSLWPWQRPAPKQNSCRARFSLGSY
jgi:hypothetical protein